MFCVLVLLLLLQFFVVLSGLIRDEAAEVCMGMGVRVELGLQGSGEVTQGLLCVQLPASSPKNIPNYYFLVQANWREGGGGGDVPWTARYSALLSKVLVAFFDCLKSKQCTQLANWN